MITAPTAVSTDQIAAFATLVRARLGDLPAEDVDDLTDGLEADLTEKAEEEELGDAQAYADELRSAAGLPAWSSATVSAADRLRRTRDDLLAGIHSSPAGAATLAFLVSLRPVWWVLRAAVATYVFAAVLFGLWSNPVGATIVFLVLLVISVQWGRGRWMPQHWLRVAHVIANVLAILVLPFALGAVVDRVALANYSYSAEMTPIPDGLLRNGGSVTNIFAYDANGDLLTGVQLFDSNGKPLSARQDGSDYTTQSDDTVLVPNSGATTGNGWNVFPLESVPSSAIDQNTGRPSPGATTTPVTPPFVRVQPLVESPVTDAGPGTSATPAPTPDPTGIPTPSPTPTP